jgi:hypothetical protein
MAKARPLSRICGGVRAAAAGASTFAETDDFAGTVTQLLGDPERCAAIGKANTVAVLDKHPLRADYRRCSTGSTNSISRIAAGGNVGRSESTGRCGPKSRDTSNAR